MVSKALAKIEPGANEPPELAQMRSQIARIIRAEYSGDSCSEFWMKPANRATDRILRAIYPVGASAHQTMRGRGWRRVPRCAGPTKTKYSTKIAAVVLHCFFKVRPRIERLPAKGFPTCQAAFL